MERRKILLSLKLLVLEVKFIWELLIFWTNQKKFKTIPITKNQNPIMFLPGFCAGDFYTYPVRKLLKKRGLICYGWEVGLNRGFNQDTLEKLQDKLDFLYQKHQAPLILIGWSMGGIFARELGWHNPTKVKKIITLGSPFSFPLRFLPINILYKRLTGHKLQEIEPLIAKHTYPEFPISLLIINSEQDGIVPWKYCLNPKNKKIKAITVRGTHLGLPYNKQVIEEILTSLI